MSLRDLFFAVSFRGDTSPIQDMDRAVDSLRENTSSAIDQMQNLGAETSSLRRVTDTASRYIQANWKQITAGALAGGVALESFARSQGEINAQLRSASVVTGMADTSIREMIGGMTDHTFKTRDAVAGMNRLIQSGYNTREQFELLLPMFDTFSDATGIHIVDAIDIFDRTLSALNIPLENASEHMDTFSWLTTQSTVNMQELAMLMRREARGLTDMGASVDHVALAMASLNAEGIRGPRSIMAFQEAMKASEGDINKFFGALGVSEDTLREQAQSLKNSEGLTKQLAAANNSAITPTQKLLSKVDELAFQYGDLAELAGFASLALFGVAKVALILGPLMSLAIVPVLGLIKAGFILLAGAIGLSVGWIVAIVAGLVIAGVLLWKNWDAITAGIASAWEWSVGKISDGWDWVKGKFDGAIEWIQNIDLKEDGINIIKGLISGLKYLNPLTAVTKVAGKIAGGFKDFFGINSPSTLMMEYGLNLTEGLQMGMETEPLGYKTAPSVSNTSTRSTFSPNVVVNVNGDNANARQIASDLEREFDDLMRRYERKLEIRNPAITVG